MAAAKARAKMSAARVDGRRSSGRASRSPRSRAIEVEIDAGHPARVDQVEVVEVDRDVERDPVVAHAALDAEAEGADLARRRTVRVAPAAGMAVPAGGRDAVRGTRLDERRLERADERPQEQAALVQRDDRVRDQLAGAVVGDLAAALDADDLDAPALEVRRRSRGCAPGRCCARGSGRPGARAGAAGRRSGRRRARPTSRFWSACADR